MPYRNDFTLARDDDSEDDVTVVYSVDAELVVTLHSVHLEDDDNGEDLLPDLSDSEKDALIEAIRESYDPDEEENVEVDNTLPDTAPPTPDNELPETPEPKE